MNDAWLNALRSDPPAQFEEQLRQRLQMQSSLAPREGPAVRKLLAAAAAVLVVAALFSVPAVRASAAALLAQFRVVNFVAVPVEPSRIETLRTQKLDIPSLIGENVQGLEDADPPVSVTSLEQAASLAGYDLRLPQWLPADAKIIEISVARELVVRVIANTLRLEQVMEALGIDDLRVPPGLTGQTVTIRVPPVVMVRYEHGGRRSRLLQAPSPEVTLPANVDLPAIGEIVLRILGLPPREAHQFAATIDWQTTLILPLPPLATTSFRRVEIGGHSGIVVTHQPPGESLTNSVLWSTGDRVFGLTSIQEMEQVLAMANSVR